MEASRSAARSTGSAAEWTSSWPRQDGSSTCLIAARGRRPASKLPVIDEADHMAALGFLPAVTRILNETPAGGQRMLFSATLDRGVGQLVTAYLTDPALHAG